MATGGVISGSAALFFFFFPKKLFLISLCLICATHTIAGLNSHYATIGDGMQRYIENVR